MIRHLDGGNHTTFAAFRVGLLLLRAEATRGRRYPILIALTVAFATASHFTSSAVATYTLSSLSLFGDPERLVLLWESRDGLGGALESPSTPTFADWQMRSHSFEELAAFWQYPSSLIIADQSISIRAVATTPNLFAGLELDPALGRLFQDIDVESVPALLSYWAWKDYFAGDSAVVGTKVDLGGLSSTVIGVLPQATEILAPGAAIWLPTRFSPTQGDRGNRAFLTVVGRLAPGITIKGAQAELNALSRAIASENPATNAGWSGSIQPFAAGFLRHAPQLTRIHHTFSIVVSAIAVLLVVSVSLSWAAETRSSTFIHTALGAGPGQLAILTCTRSVPPLAIGIAIGVGVFLWTAHMIFPLLAQAIPTATTTLLEAARGELPAVAGIALCLAIMTTGVALVASGTSGGRYIVGARRQRAWNDVCFVVVALAFAATGVLALEAGRWVVAVRRAATGLDMPALAVSPISIAGQGVRGNAGRLGAYLDLLEQERLDPRLAAVALASSVPYLGNGYEGRVALGTFGAASTESNLPRPFYHIVSPEFFTALGIKLRQGRPFSAQDARESEPVAIIDAHLARRLWPNADPVGRYVTVFETEPLTLRVVGVAESIAYHPSGNGNSGHLWVPLSQASTVYPELILIVRAAGNADPTSLFGQRISMSGVHYRPMSLQRALRLRLAHESLALWFLPATTAGVVLLSVSVVWLLSGLRTASMLRELALRYALGASPVRLIGRAFMRPLTAIVSGTLLGVAVAQPLWAYLRPADSDSSTEGHLIVLGACVLGFGATFLLGARSSGLTMLFFARTRLTDVR